MEGQYPLYDRLHQKYKQIKYKEYDMKAESAKINTILRGLDRESSKSIGEAIYALIHHHERKRNTLPREVAIDGVKLPLDGGVQYLLTKLPPVLQQMIIIFINELVDGTCPEVVDT